MGYIFGTCACDMEFYRSQCHLQMVQSVTATIQIINYLTESNGNYLTQRDTMIQINVHQNMV